MKKGFLYKMILADCIYILIMTTMILCLWIYTSISSEVSSTENYLTAFAQKTASQYSDMMQDMERISYSIATSDTVQESLKHACETDGTSNYYNAHQTQRRDLISLIQMLAGINLGSRNITIVSNAGDYIRLGIYTTIDFSRSEMLSLSPISEPDYSLWQKIMTSPRADRYRSIPDECFSFLRKISSSYGTYGYVEIQDTNDAILSILDSSVGNQEITTLIAYHDRYFFSSDADSVLYDALSEELLQNTAADEIISASENNPVTVKLLGSSRYLYTVPLKNYGLTLYFLSPSDPWTPQLTTQIIFILFIGLTICAVLCIIIIAVNNRLYRPIRDLSDQMKAFSIHENILTLPQIQGNDEITLFHQAFQTMMQNITRQNEELIDRRLREIQLSYQALQTQVSPHFLYNTLSVIGLKGEMADCPEIMDMCSYLTRMMSYSMHSQNLTVSFREEIEYMQYYLSLMQYRYLDKLQYHLSIDDTVKDYALPKFVLQPLVENCFTHGFKTVLIDIYQINVEIHTTTDGWVLSVEDNGKGFSQEDIENVYTQISIVHDSIKSPDVNSDFVYDMHSIGLIGTYARLTLTLPGKIELSIENSASGGSTVTLHYYESV